MPSDEAPPLLEVQNPPIPPENPVPPVQAAPPAAALVVNGTKNEREIELERRLDAAEKGQRDAETIAAEKQRENEDLRNIPAPPKPAKVKRKPGWSDPVFSDDEE